MGPFDIGRRGEPAVGEMAPGQPAEALAELVQVRPDQAAVRAVAARCHPDHDRRRRDTDHLAIPRRTEAAVGHLQDPHLGVGGRDARLLLLLGLLPIVFSRRSRCASTSRSLASAASTRSTRSRGPLARRADAMIAGRRIVVDLALELLDHSARLRQMLLQPGTAAVRSCPGAGVHPHAVLRQLAEIDQAAGRQRRHILGQQPVEKLAVADPEVAQRVVVQRHPAGEPAVGIMAFAQPASARALPTPSLVA